MASLILDGARPNLVHAPTIRQPAAWWVDGEVVMTVWRAARAAADLVDDGLGQTRLGQECVAATFEGGRDIRLETHAETAMMGTVGNPTARSRRLTSTPSTPGKRMSSRMASGLERWACSMNSSPVAASAVRNPQNWRYCAYPSRLSVASSTISTSGAEVMAAPRVASRAWGAPRGPSGQDAQNPLIYPELPLIGERTVELLVFRNLSQLLHGGANC